MRRSTNCASANSRGWRRPSGRSPSCWSSRRRVRASPMRKADGRHIARLSTSWRDVISHSPRGIPCSSGAQQVSVLCATTLASPADGENPPWSLAVSQAANPDQNYRTGFPRDSSGRAVNFLPGSSRRGTWRWRDRPPHFRATRRRGESAWHLYHLLQTSSRGIRRWFDSCSG